MTAQEYWERHDLQALPFTSFWMMLAVFQVDHDLTDNGMAREIGVDPKTYVCWRGYITIDSVLQLVLDRLGSRSNSKKKKLGKLALDLKRQIGGMKSLRSTIPVNRTDAHMPSKKAFDDAVNGATFTVISYWIRESRKSGQMARASFMSRQKMKGPEALLGLAPEVPWANVNDSIAAVKVAEDLTSAYLRPSQENRSESLRVALIKALEQVAQLHMHMAVLRALSIQPSEGGVDSIRFEEFEAMRLKIPELRNQVIKNANSYEAKLNQEAMAAEEMGEDDSIHGHLPFAGMPAIDVTKKFENKVIALMDALETLQPGNPPTPWSCPAPGEAQATGV